MSDNSKNLSRPGTLRDKMMTALRTSNVGKFQKLWSQAKRSQVEAAMAHHSHAVKATVAQPEANELAVSSASN